MTQDFSGWDLPEQSGENAGTEWVMPAAAPVENPVVRTGPSGMVLGEGSNKGPVTVRLFRSQPTRVLLAVPQYVTWLLTFRAISLGAHVSIFANDPGSWQSLVDRISACGGTAELLGPDSVAPGAGRPYRPSLIVDDADWYEGVQEQLGPWQAMLITADAAHSGSVFALRSCDLALVSPVDGRTSDNLRRAYALNQAQLRTVTDLAESEVALAMPRRLLRLAVPPTQTEYQLLFGG
ncbi:hypothetical protein [Enemella sp. A6]|uniref:hypothetical protein n=1 Tax=Enemella sp. A6 TaxID=3440152 RepID=UPI003EBFC7FE